MRGSGYKKEITWSRQIIQTAFTSPVRKTSAESCVSMASHTRIRQICSDVGMIISNPWGQSRHFSRANNSILDTDLLFCSSFANKNGVLDENLTIEEVERAVKSLKNCKSSGADGITAEHLKYGGPGIPSWLKRIFNSIIKLEVIPTTLNMSLVTPVFKDKGRDPLDPNNYRASQLALS